MVDVSLSLLFAVVSNVAGGVPMTSIEAQTVNVDTKPWTSDGVNPELIPIAHLESDFGRNVNHMRHPKGDWYTAFGALGLKPMTAHDEYLHSLGLQKLFPGLEDPEVFSKQFHSNAKFYNAVANHHFARLKQLLGDRSKAVAGWRWGMGAASLMTPEQIAADPYVQRYFVLAAR